MGVLDVSDIDFNSLLILLKAKSKEHVLEICEDALKNRNMTGKPPVEALQKTSQYLSCETSEGNKLLSVLGQLINLAIYESLTKTEEVAALFPQNFHSNLRDLLGKIIVQLLPQTTNQLRAEQVFSSKLLDFKWQVNMKVEDSSGSKVNQPTCFLQLTIQDPPTTVGKDPETSNVTVELPKLVLNKMLQDFGRIKDQLGAIAKK